MKRYGKRVTFRVNGVPVRMDLELTRIIPDVRVPKPKDLALDFAYTVGEALQLKRRNWRTLGLPVSRSVPRFVVEQLYEPAIFYAAWKYNLMHPGFGALVAERILVRLFSGMPEILVKYRFYLGFADEHGEIDVVSGDGKEIRPTIADPYQRLFCFQDPDVMRQVRGQFGPTVKLRHETEEYLVADQSHSVGQTLGFGACLSRIFGAKDHEAKLFLWNIYKYVRIQESHAGRLGDGAIFEIDALVSGTIQVMNFIFNHDLNLPFRRVERGPFAIPLLRLAGSRLLTIEKSLSHTHTVALPLIDAQKWYARSA